MLSFRLIITIWRFPHSAASNKLNKCKTKHLDRNFPAKVETLLRNSMDLGPFLEPTFLVKKGVISLMCPFWGETEITKKKRVYVLNLFVLKRFFGDYNYMFGRAQVINRAERVKGPRKQDDEAPDKEVLIPDRGAGRPTDFAELLKDLEYEMEQPPPKKLKTSVSAGSAPCEGPWGGSSFGLGRRMFR
jgi:hypothetical protein